MLLSVHCAGACSCYPALHAWLTCLWAVAAGVAGVLNILMSLLRQRHAPAVIQLPFMSLLLLLGRRA